MPETAAPRVWVLLGKGAGGNAQMQNLAQAVGWPFECRQLYFHFWSVIPNVLVGASLLTLDRTRSDALTPPWPDLVIAASRRSVPVARWIREQSGGRTRLVHLFHTMAPFRWFDLIITLPQYGLPERENILHLTMPLNRLPHGRIAEAQARWAPRLEALPRPWFAVLAGGNSSLYAFNRKTALRLAAEAAEWARQAGGSLLVSTSRRTSPEAADALLGAIPEPRMLYRWRPDDPDNPYLAWLGLADGFLVTADSASQLAEAFATGKTVRIFDLPLRLKPRLASISIAPHWLAAPEDVRARWLHPLRSLWRWLFETGFIKPTRDFARLHALLRARSDIRPAHQPTGAWEERDDLDRAATAVRALFGAPAARPGAPPVLK